MLSRKERNDWLRKLNTPATYAQTYLQVAKERGFSAQVVLAHAGLPAALLTTPEGRISPLEYGKLIMAIVVLSGDHGLGFEVGLRMPPTAHGSLGYALLCCGSLADATVLIQRFWHLRQRGMLCAFTMRGQWSITDLRSEAPIPEPLRHIIFDGSLAGLYRGIQCVLGGNETPGEIWFDYPEPDYFPLFRERLPVVRYGMPANQVHLPIEFLSRRLAMSNPEALQLAIAQCERENALLGGKPDDLVARVRAAMVLGLRGYPQPEQLAEKLHLSPRTFRRQLHMQGSNYLALLEDARRSDALILMDKPEIAVQAIAELLGYGNPANFTRAFRNWTGQTPTAYRALRRGLGTPR
ncbi:MAG: AraC family transcriptional regulator [Pseudomonadota bacterium]